MMNNIFNNKSFRFYLGFSLLCCIFFSSETIAEDCKVNDPDIVGQYSGDCKNGFADGFGTAKGKDNYKGEFREGKANGKGVYTWANGKRYEGEWKDGKLSGKGILTDANGRYEGEWKDNKQNGKGTVTFLGNRYEGEWKDNKYNGKGTFTWANGNRYEGEWNDGKRNGFGTMITPRSAYKASGRSKKGLWIDDNFVEQGLFENDGFVLNCQNPEACIKGKQTCDNLYTGKKVVVPIKGLLGVKNEDALVVGFSIELGLVTVRSISDQTMVVEVPCSSLR